MGGEDLDLVGLLDLVFALALLVFLVPMMLALAAAVNISDGGPIFFMHERLGRGGRTFRCLKFRSMATDADERLRRLLAVDPRARAEWAVTQKLRNDPRVTPLGRFLRQSSLDELPQIINVLRGEMSLVGPRPIVGAEISRYGRRFADYCRVRPGITGLWQISGRNDVDYRRRVAMDVIYARRRSPGLYLYILVMTAPAVLLRRGAY
jgi:lipopolysaccharide/colanic/teichoic acid biosynthesis glycosyltransferase